MISPFGVGALAVLLLYLALFFWGGAMAARAAGRSIWLFGRASGRDRLAAIGFRAAFGLAILGPLVMLALPPLQAVDPLWPDQAAPVLRFATHLPAILGAMIAFAAQMATGACWRVGVDRAAVGDLVSGGLYTISRNPTFAGQLMLLAGVALAIPSVPAVVAVLLFWLSATTPIRSEERALETALGAPYLD
jgi:protein-S-isoprenylcysteine O-methyltransferase Ste14